FVYLVGNLDSTGSQIVTHLCGIVGVDSDVVQTIFIAWSFGKKFDILLIVDFDEGNTITAVVTFQRERFVEAEKVLVECARFSQIANIEGNVSNAQDARTLDFAGLREQERSGKQNDR